MRCGCFWRRIKRSSAPPIHFSNSPDIIPHLSEVLQGPRPSKDRGRRECRVLCCTRSLACEWKKHTSVVTTGTPHHHGIPCAMVLTPLRALLGVHDFLVTVACRSSSTDLTPAKGRQDHTTSPSAKCIARLATPLASIASRAPRVVTIAIRPSCRGGTAQMCC